MGDFFKSILDSITNFFKLISDFWTGIFKYIGDIITATVDFGSNVFDSVIAFITDLPTIIIDLLFKIIGSVMDLFPQACEYCFSDLIPNIKFNWSLLIYTGDIGQSLCYILSQIKYDTALQTLSCGVMIWVILRVISIVRG